MFKCPKCKKQATKLFGTQKMTVNTPVEITDKGNEFIDLDAGYTDLYEWLNSMLTEEGKPTITGCEHCGGVE